MPVLRLGWADHALGCPALPTSWLLARSQCRRESMTFVTLRHMHLWSVIRDIGI
jgi:hypothetical protein